MTDSEKDFIATCRYYLSGEYLPKIRRAVEALPEEDLWWRPNDASNSVGNLLLHLAGNIRQWVVSGVGRRPDIRERAKEFSADGEQGGSEWRRETLLTYLEETLADVDAVLAESTSADLQRRSVVQGTDVSGLQAVFHAVEHFSMHTGQIIYVAKLRTGADLRFYEIEEGVAHRAW